MFRSNGPRGWENKQLTASEHFAFFQAVQHLTRNLPAGITKELACIKAHQNSEINLHQTCQLSDSNALRGLPGLPVLVLHVLHLLEQTVAQEPPSCAPSAADWSSKSLHWPHSKRTSGSLWFHERSHAMYQNVTKSKQTHHLWLAYDHESKHLGLLIQSFKCTLILSLSQWNILCNLVSQSFGIKLHHTSLI